MDTEYRFNKIENKYNIKVLNLVDEKTIHVQRGEYEYVLPIGNLSRTKWTPSLMTKKSLIQYLTNKINDSSLVVESVDIKSRKMLVKNILSNESTWQCWSKTNSDYLIKRTTKTTNIVNKLKNLLGEEYDYSRVDYKGVNSPIVLGCPAHGNFITTCAKNFPRRNIKDVQYVLRNIIRG